jgi:hypothetical protein
MRSDHPRSSDRRREQRLPFKAETRLTIKGTKIEALHGVSQDISRHGIRSVCQARVPLEETVHLSVTLPASQQSFSCLGQTVWCSPMEEAYATGIKLFTETPLQFSFKDVEHMLPLEEHTVQNRAGDIETTFHNWRAHQEFINEVHVGLFFSVFKNVLFSQFNRLTYNTNLSLLYLSDFDLPEIKSNHNKMDRIICTLKDSNNKFFQFCNLIQILEKEEYKKTQDDSLTEVYISKVIEERFTIIKSIFNSLDYTNVSIHFNNNFFYSNCVSLNALNNLRKGIDILLLLSIQLCMREESKTISIETYGDQTYIHLLFISDGARIFKKNRLFMDLNTAPPGFGSLEDSKDLSWLYLVLFLSYEHNPSIIVESESGNNRITLCLQPSPYHIDPSMGMA